MTTGREQLHLEKASSKKDIKDDKVGLISDGSSDDSETETGGTRAIRRRSQRTKWWFQHEQVKNNYLVVSGAWFMVALSIGGVVMEILYHTGNDAVFRGFILMIIGIVLFIPSGYAVTHIYLAARQVGRVRMESVWFFR